MIRHALAFLAVVSHIRPDERRQHSNSDCRKGRHEFGESQNIGAGILRRVCEFCHWVTIDLTNADELTAPDMPGRTSIRSLAPQQSEA